MSLLAQIAIFLAAAVVAIPIFRYFRLGSVLGYLAAGIVIGPACLGLISKVDATEHIAEFGIVLLMFVIGLELQPSRRPIAASRSPSTRLKNSSPPWSRSVSPIKAPRACTSSRSAESLIGN